MKTFLVMVMRNANFDSGLVAAHQAFLDRLRADDRITLAGPFADASGGAYLLCAESHAEAARIAEGDPLREHGVSTVSLREWVAT